MISGIGTDVLEISRVRKLLEGPSGKRFAERVLTRAERRQAQERKGRIAEFVAGRFCAKEAVVKALGCGIGKQAGFQDIEIVPDASGQPLCHLSVQARRRLQLHSGTMIHVSISHSEHTVVGFAVVEK